MEGMNKAERVAARADALFEKWRGWLPSIENHVLELYHHRELWKAVTHAIVEKARSQLARDGDRSTTHTSPI
jgi:hypothetical protein